MAFYWAAAGPSLGGLPMPKRQITIGDDANVLSLAKWRVEYHRRTGSHAYIIIGLARAKRHLMFPIRIYLTTIKRLHAWLGAVIEEMEE